MRHAWTTAALAVGGLLAAGVAAPAAMAADNCPNAAVRAQQGVQHLPNCMAYEKLTPQNKNGAIVGAEYLLSDDGQQAWVFANASITPGTVSGNSQTLLASRGADGWGLKPLTTNPLFGALRNMGPTDYLMLWGVQGMDRVLFQTNAPFAPGDVAGGAGMSTSDYYVREPDGTYRWLTQPEDGPYEPHEDIGGTISHFKASEDFSTLAFHSTRAFRPDVDPNQREHIWVWREGQGYEMVDYMPDGTPSMTTPISAGNMTSQWITPDFKTVVWHLTVRTSVRPPRSVDRLYVRVGVGTPQARTVEVSRTADGTTSCTTTEGFLGVTLDGRYVRFTCGQQLAPDAPTTGGLYVKDTQTGEIIYDEPKVDRGPMTTDFAPEGWTRPDGTYHLGKRADGLWTTNLLTGDETCVTCSVRINGQSPEVAVDGGYSGLAAGGLGKSKRNYVTPEGDVFFTSLLPLVPEDRNDHRDLYLSVDGKIHLLSGGGAKESIQMGGVSLDGSTASFGTSSALLAEDRDGGAQDIYVVRRNGGFLRGAPAAECTANCQGPAVSADRPAPPLSLTFPASADANDDAEAPVAVSGSRSVRGTSLKVKVRTPGAGRVSVSGSGLRSASKSVTSASSASVTVKLSARSQRLLRKRSSLKVTATVRFVPSSGKSQSQRVRLTFRKKAASKKKSSSRGVAAASNGKAAR